MELSRLNSSRKITKGSHAHTGASRNFSSCSRPAGSKFRIPWIFKRDYTVEGEAQAAFMASKGDVWAVASQDHDSLLFGAPRMIKNLAITGRRKLPRRSTYIEVEPKLVDLAMVLEELSLTREQLIDAGILIGTDFNPDGVKGIGPKTAVKLLHEHGNLENVSASNPEASIPGVPEIRNIFLKPEVTKSYSLKWLEPDAEKVVSFLCRERDFSEDRVRKALAKIISAKNQPTSKGTLDSYFG